MQAGEAIISQMSRLCNLGQARLPGMTCSEPDFPSISGSLCTFLTHRSVLVLTYVADFLGSTHVMFSILICNWTLLFTKQVFALGIMVNAYDLETFNQLCHPAKLCHWASVSLEVICIATDDHCVGSTACSISDKTL